MKRIAVKVMGSTGEPRDLEIYPGSSAREILQKLNLEDYCLRPRNSGRFLLEDENLFTVLEDGDMVYAVTANYSLY